MMPGALTTWMPSLAARPELGADQTDMAGRQFDGDACAHGAPGPHVVDPLLFVCVQVKAGGAFGGAGGDGGGVSKPLELQSPNHWHSLYLVGGISSSLYILKGFLWEEVFAFL